MTEQRILVTTLGSAAWSGAYIAEPDDDYPFGSYVPEAHYDVDEQDWQHVISRRGHADIGELTLAYHNGEQYVARGQQWDSLCWQLVDAQGDPVVQDVDE